jgi:hypothetical protein
VFNVSPPFGLDAVKPICSGKILAISGNVCGVVNTEYGVCVATNGWLGVGINVTEYTASITSFCKDRDCSFQTVAHYTVAIPYG